MAFGFFEYLRSDISELELSDVLRQPTTKLLGVSADAGTALREIGISTIFDLGAASLFAMARAAAAAGGSHELAGRHGMAPGDWLKPHASFDTLDQIAGLPLEVLRGITDVQATALKQALDVSTIAEFAKWPPQRVAREMIGDTVGSALTVDEIQTEALRPRFGEYPTERVYYSSLVMLDSGQSGANLVELDRPLSLKDAIGAATGFDKPAVGALVTFSQSWYAQGITLGQMLHSLALAPGEATRIAVVDFMRRVAAQASESINEFEALASQTGHQRALSEVQDSVAKDMQSGGSTSHVYSSSDSGGVGLGLSAIIPVGGAMLGSAFGGSYQGASTTTDANSSSWSLGKRSVTASMTQNVNDRTEQHSTSVRNRRATSVREVSESEHQQVSTRIVANYNHMHALTIQYYEVVQIYRVVAEVHTAERVLFLPIALADFSSDDMIEAYRGILARAALTARARDLLLDPTSTVEIRPAKSFHSALLDAALQPLLLGGRMMRMASAPAPTEPEAGAAVAAPATAIPARRAEIAPIPVASFLASDAAVVRGSAIVMRPIVRQRSSSLFYPDEVELVALQLEGIAASRVTLSMVGGATPSLTLQANDPVIELATPVAIGEIADISVQKQAAGVVRGLVRLHLSFRGRRFTSPDIPVSMPDSRAGTSFSVAKFSSDTADRKAELKSHLATNRAHYSAQVFRSLSSAEVVGLLSKYRWQGRSLAEQVEPKVLSVAGNFIVLRAPVEPGEASGLVDGAGGAQPWSRVLDERHLSPHSLKDQRMVPIPTDGVFAEAVLGRSNSAEKLDITRFWNWQDSPAPLTPPELAPVSAESRARGETIEPGRLGPATLNIVNPTNLPDPAGLNASLNALAALNFRDMSGLAGTQDLAGIATTGTLTATTEAGRNATAMAGVAADVLKTAITAGYGRKKEGGVSADGARINHGRDMDERKGGSLDGGTATGADGSDHASGGGSGGASAGFEASAFNDSVGNPLASIPDELGAVLDGSDFKKAIGQLTGDPDAVILAGGTTNTLESWGAFGTEVRIYQNTEVVAKLVKFLKRSAKFNANAVALGKLYRSASGWSEARMKAKGEQNAKFEREWDDMTKGTYKGRPFLTVQPGETDEGAAFARGVNMWGFGDAIYHGRFLFDDIPSRLVPQIVHEVSHALRPRGSPPSDLGAAILKGIDEEVKVRQETRDILKEISAGGGVSFAASDTMPELRPGNIERDVSPGLGMTYLESIATSVWLQAAMKRDNIDWETAERLRSEAEAIFPAAPIDQRDYSKEYFKKLRLKASWKAFNASTPPTAPDYVTKRNAKADEHVQNILNSNVMYRAFLP
jgi:hypothetical protein